MNAEKLFGTRNLYEILQLKPDAQILDGKQMIFLQLCVYIATNIGTFYPLQ